MIDSFLRTVSLNIPANWHSFFNVKSPINLHLSIVNRMFFMNILYKFIQFENNLA